MGRMLERNGMVPEQRETNRSCREDSEELLQRSLLLSHEGLSDASSAKFSDSAQMRALNCLRTAVRGAVTDLHPQLVTHNLWKMLLPICVRLSWHTWLGQAQRPTLV